ncbi:MAG: S9 family peptidase [Bacteroidales bacterium]|nr:S9 family peptidase [Bacteroidales bacterium]
MKFLSNRFLSVLMLAVGIGFCSPALAGDNGLSIEDITRLKRVTSVELSEDGSYIAYTVTDPADPVKENNPAEIHLYVYNTNNQESKAYYTLGSVSDVAFRPERETVTFIARPEGEEVNAIYEMPLHGGAPMKLYQFETSVSDYEWASDGDRLAFTATAPEDEKQSKLPFQPDIYEEGLRNRKGYLIDLSESSPSAKPLKAEGSIYTLRWSPDNERLAIGIAPTPLVDDYYMKQDVKVVSAETREIITDDIQHEGKLADIRWSPGGERLALLAGNDIHDVIAGRIMIVSADGGNPENIHPDFKGKFEQIAWTDPNTIHFIASESTERGFGTISPDGSDFNYKLKPGGLIYESFSYADKGHIAFEVNTPKHPGEVYYKAPYGAPERVTHVNPWLDDVRMSEQSVVTYEARDGLKIEGLLIKPVNYEEGTEVPLIVNVHGGPEAHYSNGWLTYYSSPGQMAAAKGYAVFYPNYRGSTGRGIEFLKSSQGDAAGAEYDDIVDGVDYLIDKGIADPERIGVTGGSYGGYATGWMATYYSDRFAAGVMNFGISNNISKWGTSDIPEELYLVHARERLWEDNNWQKYLERSPIYHVGNAQTPLLITHGKADTRVHPSQSLELFRHMKVRKPEVPLRLVRYPGAGHGYRRATAQYDYTLRMFRWFDTYLKGDGEFPDRSIDEELPE